MKNLHWLKSSESSFAKLLTALGILLIMLMFSCQQPVQTPDCDIVYTSDKIEDVRAIKDILKNIEERWNQKDIEFHANLLADEVVAIPPDRPSMSGKTIRVKNIENFLSNNDDTWIIKSIDDVIVSGGLAIARTTARDSFTSKTTGETTIIDNSEGLLVFKKEADDQWKIILETWNDPDTPKVDNDGS